MKKKKKIVAFMEIVISTHMIQDKAPKLKPSCSFFFIIKKIKYRNKGLFQSPPFKNANNLVSMEIKLVIETKSMIIPINSLIHYLDLT